MVVDCRIVGRFLIMEWPRGLCLTVGGIGSQASEGMWGMPGHTEAMKAVVSCDKLGGVAHTR